MNLIYQLIMLVNYKLKYALIYVKNSNYFH